MLNQLQDCEDSGIPLVIIIASGEMESGTVKLRSVSSREETTVSRQDMIPELQTRLTTLCNGTEQ